VWEKEKSDETGKPCENHSGGASGQITSTKHLCIFVGRGGDLPNGYLYAV